MGFNKAKKDASKKEAKNKKKASTFDPKPPNREYMAPPPSLNGVERGSRYGQGQRRDTLGLPAGVRKASSLDEQGAVPQQDVTRRAASFHGPSHSTQPQNTQQNYGAQPTQYQPQQSSQQYLQPVAHNPQYASQSDPGGYLQPMKNNPNYMPTNGEQQPTYLEPVSTAGSQYGGEATIKYGAPGGRPPLQRQPAVSVSSTGTGATQQVADPASYNYLSKVQLDHSPGVMSVPAGGAYTATRATGAGAYANPSPLYQSTTQMPPSSAPGNVDRINVAYAATPSSGNIDRVNVAYAATPGGHQTVPPPAQYAHQPTASTHVQGPPPTQQQHPPHTTAAVQHGVRSAATGYPNGATAPPPHAVQHGAAVVEDTSSGRLAPVSLGKSLSRMSLETSPPQTQAPPQSHPQAQMPRGQPYAHVAPGQQYPQTTRAQPYPQTAPGYGHQRPPMVARSASFVAQRGSTGVELASSGPRIPAGPPPPVVFVDSAQANRRQTMPDMHHNGGQQYHAQAYARAQSVGNARVYTPPVRVVTQDGQVMVSSPMTGNGSAHMARGGGVPFQAQRGQPAAAPPKVKRSSRLENDDYEDYRERPDSYDAGDRYAGGAHFDSGEHHFGADY